MFDITHLDHRYRAHVLRVPQAQQPKEQVVFADQRAGGSRPRMALVLVLVRLRVRLDTSTWRIVTLVERPAY